MKGGKTALRIEGAGEHNLRDVDVDLGSGLTAIVGVSGSGKSSLAFDVIHHEARRRLIAALSLSSPWSRVPPARVRRIRGLAPAVGLGQDTVIRNPSSTVASASGVLPFLRVLYSRFATRVCAGCGTPVVVVSREERVAAARRRLGSGDGALFVPLLVDVPGTHARLLGALERRFGAAAIEVDGGKWSGRALAAGAGHSVAVRTGTLPAGASAASVRAALAEADALGSPVVELRCGSGTETFALAPVCPACGRRHEELRPADLLRAGDAYRLDGVTLAELVARTVAETAAELQALELPPAATRSRREALARLDALAKVGLDYLPLDRPSPTLSRGEAQRLRLAVLLTNEVDGVVHVLDEPTIGLAQPQVAGVLSQLSRLRGPVLMVEHDRWAVASADDVVELGPGAGPAGGRVVFQGTPAALWRSDTVSGRAFRAHAPRRRRAEAPTRFLEIAGANARNLRSFDCQFPVGRLSVVAGPSGAGKTTLTREVLVASLEAGKPIGCARLDGPQLRAVVVDQSPIGRNTRSNPATYSGLAARIRDLFASRSELPPAAFSFNRAEGACPECKGLGAIELEHRYLPTTWLTCETCGGRRFDEESLSVRLDLGDGRPRSIADVLELSVDEAQPLLAHDTAARRRLESLAALGLGYVKLGQPSPSLSGGEAQRVKLAKQLAVTGDSDLLVVDEPTTGLHPSDLARLLDVLRATAERGATVVVVEHNPDVLAVADWVVRLGPEGGPRGGELLYAGTPERRPRPPRPRARPRAKPRSSDSIRVRGASAHNLRDVSLDIENRRLTVLAGVSGSGKTSLLVDVVAAEASRRLLECLSLYERQSVKEGPEAPVREVAGLGPTIFIDPTRPFGRRSTVGSASEVAFQVAVLLAYAGVRGRDTPELEPRHFLPSSYEGACLRCSGIGTVGRLREERLIARPERSLTRGAFYSPGFFPGGYFGKPGNGGHAILLALAERYRFDPDATAWQDLSGEAREAFLFGDDEPLEVELRTKVRTSRRTVAWGGIFSIIEHWDVGGLYTEHVTCPACGGGRLRPELLEVTLHGLNRQVLHGLPLAELERVLARPLAATGVVADALAKARRRVEFLVRVGLGYVHLDRTCATLSAGEAQRLKLSALLGGELTDMTVLLDEPSRGLHPGEVTALADELRSLADSGNTVVAVEHDPLVLERAHRVVVFGPEAGRRGGRIVASGRPSAVRSHLLPSKADRTLRGPPRQPRDWIEIRRPRENNLTGEDVRLPLGVVAGVCGVSGSGKSTLVVDTLGRALAPTKVTTSVAHEQVDPGAHDAIDGAPGRTVVVDQALQGATSPGALLGVSSALRRVFAASDDAVEAELTAADLAPACDACRGRGFVREDMGFLPTVTYACDACDGTGYTAEARALRLRDHTLPETEALELERVRALWSDDGAVAEPLGLACELGLGHLALRQPAASLSRGELQRLKLVAELRRRPQPTLFVLDEPTVGQHDRDVARLIALLDRLVDEGHSVLLVDHHPRLLAACDWLLELGPGGGPDGGHVIAAGTPASLAAGTTPTAPYLREALA